MEVVNMTPHAINIVDAEGKHVMEIPASGNQIRLSVQTVSQEPLGIIPTSSTVFGEPVGLPEYKDGVFYIVSQLVKNALPTRSDLLVPAEMVRDEKGNIVGCKSLGR